MEAKHTVRVIHLLVIGRAAVRVRKSASVSHWLPVMETNVN